MRVHAVTWHEGEHYVSRCVGANVVSQGSTPEEAEAGLVEAITLSGVALPEEAEAPRLTVLDAPSRGTDRAAYDDIDGAALLRELEESGWTIEERGRHVVLTKHGRAVVVPLAARLAPGVYHVVRAALAEAMAEEVAARKEVFARLDALFAANPWEGDVTAIIREQRDSR